MKTLIPILIAIAISGCGGGGDNHQDYTAAPPHTVAAPAAKKIAMAAASAAPSAADRLMNFAEVNFAQYFPSKQTTRHASTLAYRFYPETAVFLIVDGDKIFVAGGLFGADILYVGLINDYAPALFPFRSAYRAMMMAGSNENFNVTGTCSGSANITTGAALPGIFEGVQGYSVAQTLVQNFKTCTPSSSSSSAITYYDQNFSPIGSQVPGFEYSKFEAPPIQLPETVKAGDSAAFGTMTTYADSTKNVVTGKRVISYEVSAESDSSAILTLSFRRYNTQDQLLLTQQERYRLTTEGAAALLSIDLQYSTTSSVHLLYTKI